MPQSFSILKVHGGTIFSSCSDGQIYLHSFPEDQPHYDMAETENSTSVMINRGNGSVSVSADPEQPTELCEGPKRCKTGKTGLVKSSSSFQVSKISIMFNYKCASQSSIFLVSVVFIKLGLSQIAQPSKSLWKIISVASPQRKYF